MFAFPLLLCILFLCPFVDERVHGVCKKMQKYYNSEHSKFVCLDNSLVINYDQVNDDYCDCSDGSDEPGTSACSNGEFCCRNVGYKSKMVSSRVVNDRICDCCDGSDEKEGICDNKCHELYQAEITVIKGEKSMIEKAKHNCKHYLETQNLEKYSEKLISELDDELAQVRQEMVNIEQLINAKQADYDEKMADDQKNLNGGQEDKEHNYLFGKLWDYFKLIDLNGDEKISKVECLLIHRDIVRELMTYEKIDFSLFSQILLKEKNLELLETEILERHIHDYQQEVIRKDEDDKKHTYPGWDSPFENDHETDDDFDPDDLHSSEFVSSQIINFLYGELKVIASRKTPEKNIPVEITSILDEKEKLKKNVTEFTHRIQHLEMHKADIKTFQTEDFGPDRVFSVLFESCYPYYLGGYEYEVCPFRKISKKTYDKHVLIGRYSGWNSKEEAYTSMLFDIGDECDTDKNLRTFLNLECGSKNEILSIQDQFDCSYIIKLATEAACYVRPTPEVDESQYQEEL